MTTRGSSTLHRRTTLAYKKIDVRIALRKKRSVRSFSTGRTSDTWIDAKTRLCDIQKHALNLHPGTDVHGFDNTIEMRCWNSPIVPGKASKSVMWQSSSCRSYASLITEIVTLLARPGKTVAPNRVTVENWQTRCLAFLPIHAERKKGIEIDVNNCKSWWCHEHATFIKMSRPAAQGESKSRH